MPGDPGFKWQQESHGGHWTMAKYIEAVETEDEATLAEVMDQILAYNRDDLAATWAVLQWLRWKKGVRDCHLRPRVAGFA